MLFAARSERWAGNLCFQRSFYERTNPQLILFYSEFFTYSKYGTKDGWVCLNAIVKMLIPPEPMH